MHIVFSAALVISAMIGQTDGFGQVDYSGPRILDQAIS
jgi:hypothetical protein